MVISDQFKLFTQMNRQAFLFWTYNILLITYLYVITPKNAYYSANLIEMVLGRVIAILMLKMGNVCPKILLQ